MLRVLLAATSAAMAVQAFKNPLPPLSPLLQNLTCTQCTDIVTEAFAIAQNQTALAQLVQVLDAQCNATYVGNATAAATCRAIEDFLATSVLPWVEKQIATLAWDPINVCAVFIPVCNLPCCTAATQPEQVRLSLTGDATTMRVMWITLNNTASSTVQWGQGGPGSPMPNSATGTTRTYTFGGWVGVIHLATMTGLAPDTAYTYRVGDSASGWSDAFSFTTLPTVLGTDARPLRILQIGDMAYDHASDATVQSMISLVQAGQVDLIFHVGDVSYADGAMQHWDDFGRKIQPISAAVPYMVGIGNHEAVWQNGCAYVARWSMPNETVADSKWWSLNLGTLHLVMTNTESPIDTSDIDPQQLAWLTADLAAASAARQTTPWIIVGGHRPLYCSNHDNTQCGLFADILQGLVEELYYTNKVDLVVAAHEHGWERLWPTWKQQPTQTNYSHPAAPVYVVNGAAGNREGNEKPAGDKPWSAFSSGVVGYSLITVTDSNITMTFYNSSDRSVVDSFVLTH